MHRKHYWVILIAILLSLLSIFLPLLVAYYLSWSRATVLEQARLSEVTNRLTTRVKKTYSETESVLLYLNKQNIISPCSQDHIQLMRDETLKSPMIEEVGFFQNGYLLCGAWGKVTPTKIKFTDEITKNGIHISLDSKFITSPNIRMIVLRFGNYYALVNPLQFSNIILDPNMRVAVLSLDGVLVASSNNPDLPFIKSYIFDKVKPDSSKYMIAVGGGDRFIAIATEPKTHFYETLTKQQLFLLPLGFLLALPIIAIIIYFSRRRLSIESELEYAIENNKLEVYYQPIIDLKSGRCSGAEALIRWFTSNNESIPPDYFVPVAEKAGSISKITKYVINAVTRDMASLLIADKNLHISINFSVHDFHNQAIISFLEEKIHNSGISRDQIWLEITERQIVAFETTAAVIEDLRKTGYQFAMDDFGTGYSNLSYLNNLTLDLLKIDKSFIDTIEMNTVTSGITEDIINMAKRLNLKIIAEGVETAIQRDYLLERKVEFGQGWLFSKALSRNDFLKYLQNTNRELR